MSNIQCKFNLTLHARKNSKHGGWNYFIPVFLLAGLSLFLYGGCGRSTQAEFLESYRIPIGDTDCTFRQQVLYLMVSLELYRSHVGAYPSEQNNLEALLRQPEQLESTGMWRGPYVKSASLFLDPWKQKLVYKLTQSGIPDLSSLGQDGIPSEDDIAAKNLLPDIFRELEKRPQLPATLIPSATPS